MGKKGIVIGGGGGSAFDQTGASNIPIWINAQDEAEAVTSISDSLLTNTTAGKAKVLVDNSGNPYNVGGDDTPIKFKNGVPVAITGTLKNDISGNAATATNSSKLYINTTNTSTDYYILGATGTSAGYKDVYNAHNSGGSKNSKGIRFNASTGVLLGAAWNDFAEFRTSDEEAGVCVVEDGSGRLIKSSKRLEKVAYIISDTFGMSVGVCDETTRPIAVSGRVLAYSNDKLKVGDAVCSGKNGTVSKMSRLEIILFPDRIIGVVSEIPIYEEWNEVQVNNRIWIKVV